MDTKSPPEESFLEIMWEIVEEKFQPRDEIYRSFRSFIKNKSPEEIVKACRECCHKHFSNVSVAKYPYILTTTRVILDEKVKFSAIYISGSLAQRAKLLRSFAETCKKLEIDESTPEDDTEFRKGFAQKMSATLGNVQSDIFSALAGDSGQLPPGMQYSDKYDEQKRGLDDLRKALEKMATEDT